MDGRTLAASSGSSSNDFRNSYREMKGKNKISVTSMVSARRKSSPIVPEGRDRDFPVLNHDDLYNMLEIEAELAKMRNMTAEEAASRAAQVVAEAETALAEAEEAMREADAAEADALAAVAALLRLRGRSTNEMMPCPKKSGG